MNFLGIKNLGVNWYLLFLMGFCGGSFEWIWRLIVINVMGNRLFDTISIWKIYLFYILYCFLATYVVKWSLPTHHLVCHDTQTPYINTAIILLPISYLRTHIIQSPTISTPSIDTDGCPPKITNLTNILLYINFTWVNTIF